MADHELKKIVKFFFFALLDEDQAIKVSRSAIGEYIRKVKDGPKDNPRSIEKNKLIVEITHKWFKKVEGKLIRGHAEISFEKGWQKSPLLDFSSWMSFHKEVQFDDLLCVIWIHLLKIEEEAVAEVLGVSPATVLYRVSRGARQLGHFLAVPIEKGPANA